MRCVLKSVLFRCSGFIAVFFIVSAATCSLVFAQEKIPVRIGWQTSWATQGQLACILKKTNILELNGLDGEFQGFTYGGPLNEGALSGAVDVIFTADQPACLLLAKGAKWKIIGRLIYNRVATVAPILSEAKTMADLKGGVVGIPFGSAAHRETLRALKNAGLDPAKDVSVKNIGIYEETNVIHAGDERRWGEFTAFATWDPPLAELEITKKAKVLDNGLVTAVIVMSEDFIAKHPDGAEKFLKAYIMAFYYYATNKAAANEWYKSESKLTFDTAVLDLAASVEPNLKAKELFEINIRLSAGDIATIQAAADFIDEQKMTDNHLTDISAYVDQNHLERALEGLKDVDMSVVKVK